MVGHEKGGEEAKRHLAARVKTKTQSCVLRIRPGIAFAGFFMPTNDGVTDSFAFDTNWCHAKLGTIIRFVRQSSSMVSHRTFCGMSHSNFSNAPLWLGESDRGRVICGGTALSLFEEFA